MQQQYASTSREVSAKMWEESNNRQMLRLLSRILCVARFWSLSSQILSREHVSRGRGISNIDESDEKVQLWTAISQLSNDSHEPMRQVYGTRCWNSKTRMLDVQLLLRIL
jgi:hypothetical protein